MKEGMDCVKDVKLDYVLVLLIKEGRDAIRTRSFVKAKLEHRNSISSLVIGLSSRES